MKRLTRSEKRGLRMADSALLLPLSLALATFAALLYLALGIRLGRRKVTPAGALANHAWQAWWLLLAVSTLVGTVLTTILAALDLYTLAFGQTVMVVNLALIFGALWGLSYYLAYLTTGRIGVWKPFAWFYGASVVGWLYTIFAARPVDTVVEDGVAALLYAEDLTAQPLYIPLLLALLLPVLGAALAYAYLGIKADDRTVRFRIALVSGSLIVWFGISLVATLAGLSDLQAWPVLSRIISLAAAAVIYVAHFPPALVVRALKLRPVEVRDD